MAGKSGKFGLFFGAAALALAFAVSPQADAQSIPASMVPIFGTYTGTVQIIGQTTGSPPLTEFISLASSDSAALTLNSYDSHGFLDLTTGVATGQNAFVADDGSGVLFGTFTQFNTLNPDPLQTSTFTGTEVFTSGGGIFDGTSGSASFFGTFAQEPGNPTVADFTITFNGSASAVPEPGALALLGSICLGGIALLGRRRFRRPTLCTD